MVTASVNARMMCDMVMRYVAYNKKYKFNIEILFTYCS